MRDRIGLAFFTFAAVVSFLAAWEHPSLLAWLAAMHNAVLAAIYVRRKPPVKYDRLGLWLGLLAAVLPLTTIYSVEMSLPLIITGILGLFPGFLVAYFVRESLRNCSRRSWAGRAWPLSYCAASDVPGRAGAARCVGSRFNPGASCRWLAHCPGCDPDPACLT